MAVSPNFCSSDDHSIFFHDRFAANCCCKSSKIFRRPSRCRWSADYIAGKRDAVLRGVEADLLSPGAHPFSTQIWTSIHFNHGDLRAALERSSPQLIGALGTFPGVLEQYSRREYRNLVDAFLGGTIKPADPWSLYFVARAAENLQDERSVAAVAEALVEQFPELFATVVWLGVMTPDTFAERDLIIAIFHRHPALKESDAGKAGWALLQQRTYHPQGRLRVTDLFIKTHPRDMTALRLKADALLDLHRYGEAAESFSLADAAYPFITRVGPTSDRDGWLKAVFRLGQHDEMEHLALRFALETYPVEQAELMAQVAIVDTLTSLGEHGEAQRVLDAALQRWPTSPDLLDLAAGLDLAALRKSDAVQHSGKAAATRPDNLAYQERLIKALTAAGQTEQAIAQFNTAADRLKAPPASLFWTAAEAPEARKDWAEAGRIYDRGLALYPNNATLLDDKAWLFDKRGMKQEAFSAIKQAADAGPATAWRVARFREYSISALGAEAAKLEIEALRQRQPWNQSVWSDAAGALREDQIAKEAIWEAARAANPEEPWAWVGSVTTQINEKNWDEARKLLVLAQAVAIRLPKGSALAEEIAEDSAWLATERGSAGLASKEEVQAALVDRF
jgi:tetratricopeptide (TPR) repeat protein